MPIGMNFEFIKDYSPAWVFTDAFLESRSWQSQAYDTVTRIATQDNTPVAVDQLGWPTQLATGTNAQGHPTQQYLTTDIFNGLSGGYAGGQYYAQWDGGGDGNLVWGGDAVVTKQDINAGGHHYALLNVTPGNAGIRLTITGMQSQITNIHVWMPDYNGQSFVGQVWQPGASFSPFHPLFLQRLSGFTTLRPIHWELGVSSQEVSWSDRRPYNYARQGSFAYDSLTRSCAPEYLIELVNELHTDIWFCMPPMTVDFTRPPAVADDYLTNFATLARNTLNPNLKIYVEWSDEAWNPTAGYLAHTYILQQMTQPQNAGLDFYQMWAKDAGHVFDVWESVFAGQTNRLVRVAAGQAGNTYVTTQLVQDLHGNFDAIAIAPYMDMLQSQLNNFGPNTTVDDVFTQLYNTCLPNALMEVDSHAALAMQYSTSLGRHIPLIAYEGGASLLPQNSSYAQAFYQAGLDPRMYDLYYQYLRALPAHGLELFLNFCYTGGPYQQLGIGDFGALHAMDQPLSAAPKFRALEDAVSGLVFQPDVSITAVNPTALESGPVPGTFRISRTGDTSPALTISYQLSGSDSLTDYTGLPATIVLPAGQVSIDIPITPISENLIEGDRTVSLTLLAGTGFTVNASAASATITIVDKDNRVYYNLPIQNPSFETGNLSGWSLTPATNNFTAVGGITDPAAPPSAHDGHFFVWGAGTNGSQGNGATPAGVAQRIDLSSQAAGIDGGMATLTYTGWGAGNGSGAQNAYLELQFYDGSANAIGSSLDSNRAIAAGVWTQLQLTATVPVGARLVELRALTQRPTGFFSNRAGFDDLSGQLTYINSSTVSIQATTPSALEATLQPAMLTVTRASANLTNSLLVSYTVGGTGRAGISYQPLPGTVIIPAGSPSVTISITPINDQATLGNETVTVTLARGTVYQLGSATTAQATIVDALDSANSSTTGTGAALPVPEHLLVIGQDTRGPAEVIAYDAVTLAPKLAFYPFGGLPGGVRVAVGAVTARAVADIITGTGPGPAAEVRVFDGLSQTLRYDFYPYGSFNGGVFVAVGDVNGDGYADVIVGPDAGTAPLVRVYDGRTGSLLRNFYAFAEAFSGGVRVAAGDVNGDGFADIITGTGPGVAAEVKVYSGADGIPLRDFYVYDSSFRGGIYVAAGDINGDHHADILTGPGAGMGSELTVFDGNTATKLLDFYAGVGGASGVRVGVVTVQATGESELVVGAGLGAGTEVQMIDHLSLQLIDDFFAFATPSAQSGAFIAGG
jgi:hypothetical protein